MMQRKFNNFVCNYIKNLFLTLKLFVLIVFVFIHLYRCIRFA